MAYTVGEIKVLAYNYEEKEDFSIPEFNLFLGLAYAYEWFRAHPEDKDQCTILSEYYIDFYEATKHLNWNRHPKPSWLERAQEKQTIQKGD